MTLASAGLLALGLALDAQDPAIAIIQMPKDTRVTGTMMIDLDGDHRTDLVLACRDGASRQRSLHLHLRQERAPAFTSAPSRPKIAIDRDVIAFTFADCLPNPGPELILMTSEQVAVLVPGADGAAGYRRLTRHRLVWPAADRDEIVPLPDAAVDVDGDGLVDLLLPGPDGWTLLCQDRDGEQPRFEHRFEHSLPRWQNPVTRAVQGAALGDRAALARRLGDAFASRPGSGDPLVGVSARTPSCLVVDLEGDGRLDLAAQRNGRMFAAQQTARRQFEVRERALPLPADRLTLADPTFDVQFTDIDGDGRADLLLTTSARRDEDLETRVDLYRTRPDGTWPDEPDGRLRLQTLAQPPALVDVDGDGRRDLVCLSLRTSSMREFLGDKASALDAQLSVFRNDGTQFVRPPLLAQALPLAAIQAQRGPVFLTARAGRAGRAGDVLLYIDGGIERRPLVASGERMRLGAANGRFAMPQPTAPADQQTPGPRIVVADPEGDDILLLIGSEVRHLGFTR